MEIFVDGDKKEPWVKQRGKNKEKENEKEKKMLDFRNFSIGKDIKIENRKRLESGRRGKKNIGSGKRDNWEVGRGQKIDEEEEGREGKTERRKLIKEEEEVEGKTEERRKNRERERGGQ